MNIHYEKAKVSDYKDIHAVMATSARELSRKAYSRQLLEIFDRFYVNKTPEYIRQSLENPNIYTMVAKYDDRIIGFVQLRICEMIGNLNHLYIYPGYEGNSIGTRLLNIVKERAAQLKITTLYVESTLNALSYYERHGFINTGLIPENSAYNLILTLQID